MPIRLAHLSADNFMRRNSEFLFENSAEIIVIGKPGTFGNGADREVGAF